MPKLYDAETIARARRAIAANNGSLNAASKELGIARSTLRQWQAGKFPGSSSQEAVATAEPAAGRALAHGYREIEALYKDQLKDPTVVSATKAKDAALVVGIMSDKAQRAEGGPTSINENRVRVSLVAPGALKALKPGVIEGEYRELGARAVAAPTSADDEPRRQFAARDA
jgi:hypothetical protein